MYSTILNPQQRTYVSIEAIGATDGKTLYFNKLYVIYFGDGIVVMAYCRFVFDSDV